MLKKCACGGRVGPEACEEGRGAKAKPRGYTERRGRPAEQRCIKDTKLNHRPCLGSSVPLTLPPYFQKDQHQGKQQSLRYCCYHFQTAIFQPRANLDNDDDDCVSSCTFHFTYLQVFTDAALTHVFCQFLTQPVGPEPLAALPSAVVQPRMDLAGHGRSGHRSHPHTEVMKEDSVPPTHTPPPMATEVRRHPGDTLAGV